MQCSHLFGSVFSLQCSDCRTSESESGSRKRDTDLAFMLCMFYTEPCISCVMISSGRATYCISRNLVHSLKAKSVLFQPFQGARSNPFLMVLNFPPKISLSILLFFRMPVPHSLHSPAASDSWPRGANFPPRYVQPETSGRERRTRTEDGGF